MVGQSAIDRYSSIDSSITQTNICTRRSVQHFYKAQKYFSPRQPSKKRKTANGSICEIKENTPSNHTLLPEESELCEIGSEDGIQDTVGVVCIDSKNNIACAMSSGGSVFKYSGRLGQCCVHGAGSYASPTLGIVTTGNGEQIINKLLAVTLAHKLPSSDNNPLELLNSCFEEQEGARMCGVLILEHDGGGMVTVHAQHTLTNMVVGFRSSAMVVPVAKVIKKSSPAFLQSVKL